MGVIGGEGASLLTAITERVEEPVVATTVPTTGSYSSGAKKPPGTNDSSKKHKSSKVNGKNYSLSWS